jgi:redox-sensing transcriptional repressor
MRGKKSEAIRFAASDEAAARLPRYWRLASQLQADGRDIVSSAEIAERLGLGAAQVRRDLSTVGLFGTRGRGYPLDRLAVGLRARLGLDRCWRVTIVRENPLVSLSPGVLELEPGCFEIVAIYDASAEADGAVADGPRLRHLDELADSAANDEPDIGIVALGEAQTAVDTLVAAGARAILSYTAAPLHVPTGVELRRVDPLSMLESMTLRLTGEGQSAPPRRARV